MSSSTPLDLVLNKESSKYSSKGRSSKNNHQYRQESALMEGVGLTKLSCLLDILEIRLGLSNTWGGFGSGLALV